MEYLVLQNLGGTGRKACRKPRRVGSQWGTIFLNKATGLRSLLCVSEEWCKVSIRR